MKAVALKSIYRVTASVEAFNILSNQTLMLYNLAISVSLLIIGVRNVPWRNIFNWCIWTSIEELTELKITLWKVCSSGFEITAGHHCGGETFQSIFSLFGWKYSEKSLLHSDDRLLFRTLPPQFVNCFKLSLLVIFFMVYAYRTLLTTQWANTCSKSAK